MKYLGCAYYPEYWGAARFAVDARLMQAAGINIVRIGEFAWCRMEPEEGHYTLDWLHTCFETLHRHGISVLMCTPTATPPAWLTSTYPQTCLVRADGSRATHGSRRHYCTTCDTYRRLGDRITEVLACELARHPNLAGWQLDNEFGPESGWCYCENCQARFQAWLQARYGTVAEINRRWATGFWSMDYTDWRQIRLGDNANSLYSSRNLDSKRFWSDMMIEFARRQAETIRRTQPGAFVTTNGMGPIFSPIDYYRLFDFLDVACDDLYFDIGTMDTDVAAMNIFRCIKPGRPYWITETGSAALDHNKPPHPDQFRAWAWSSLAHGAEAHFVFRWRTCLSGQEQELQGILEHSGEPRHRYAAVRTCFQELRRLWPKLCDLPLPQPEVAIIQDYQTLWGYESSRVGRDVDYMGLIFRLHKQLYRCNVPVDIIPPGRNLSAYKLVVLPSLMMIEADFAKDLHAYVKSGGCVLGIGQIGMRDQNDNYLPTPGPEHLHDLFGIRIEGGMYLKSHMGPDEALWVPAAKQSTVELPIEGVVDGTTLRGAACGWAADISLRGGTSVARFTTDTYAGQPALTTCSHAKGMAVYAAAVRFDDHLTRALLDWLLRHSGAVIGPDTPEHVEVVRRGPVTFVVNHTDKPAEVPLGLAGEALLGDFRDGAAHLKPYGVCVIRAAKPSKKGRAKSP